MHPGCIVAVERHRASRGVYAQGTYAVVARCFQGHRCRRWWALIWTSLHERRGPTIAERYRSQTTRWRHWRRTTGICGVISREPACCRIPLPVYRMTGITDDTRVCPNRSHATAWRRVMDRQARAGDRRSLPGRRIAGPCACEHGLPPRLSGGQCDRRDEGKEGTRDHGHPHHVCDSSVGERPPWQIIVVTFPALRARITTAVTEDYARARSTPSLGRDPERSETRRRECMAEAPLHLAVTYDCARGGPTRLDGGPRLSTDMYRIYGAISTCGWRRVPKGLGWRGCGWRTRERWHGCWDCRPACSSSPISAWGSRGPFAYSSDEARRIIRRADVSTHTYTRISGGRQAGSATQVMLSFS